MYTSKTCRLLVSDDSWYFGLALSFGVMSKALTIEKIWVLNRIAFKNGSKKRKVSYQLWSDNLVFAFIEVRLA